MLYCTRGAASVPSSTYQFADFKLHCDRYELLREGHSIKLERKPMELLILLASREGQLVTRAEITQRLWDSDVFVDTEHGINTAIRKIRTVLRDDPESPRFVQTVTGMGYRFVAPVVTEPPPLVADAPALENEPVPGPAHQIGRHIAYRALWPAAAAALLLVAVAAIAFVRHRSAGPAIHSIAVLPLENLSGDSGQNYFADGVTEELTTMLARDSTLRVTSRTSAMQYKDAHQPIPAIARALNVDAVIEGSVSRAADRVHMTVQLIRADTDTHLWAQSYDRNLDEVPNLPSDAARDIAAYLHTSVPESSAARYVNPTAHDAYLQGKYLWFSDGHLGESGKYFQKAIETQPDYAMGWAWLSMYYGAATVDGLLDPRTSLIQEDAAAERAMQLDPNLAEAHQAMAASLFFHHWDMAGADQEILRAISLDPHDSELYHLRAKILISLNRTDEAVEIEKKAMEINPFERPWGLAYIYTCARRYDDALREDQLRLKDYPTDPVLIAVMATTYRRVSDMKESVEFWARFAEVTGNPQMAAGERRAFQQGGERGYYRWLIAQREALAKTRYISPVELASYHALLGEREPALALLNEGADQRSPAILNIQTDPAFDFLHSDPRYRELIKRVGLPAAN